MRALAAALVAAGTLAGCATAPAPATGGDLFVVLPSAEGHVGRIDVTAGGEVRAIDTAYGGQRVARDGTMAAVRLTREQVHEGFGETLAALPGRPATFTLYFLEGRDELTPDSRSELQKVIDEIARRPLPDIAVIGHTDSVGASDYNDRLSLARAERVREILAARGLPRARMQTAGRGERELLVPTEDNVAEPRNRRVEINVR